MITSDELIGNLFSKFTSLGTSKLFFFSYH
jgi:hypothetical protein